MKGVVRVVLYHALARLQVVFWLRRLASFPTACVDTHTVKHSLLLLEDQYLFAPLYLIKDFRIQSFE